MCCRLASPTGWDSKPDLPQLDRMTDLEPTFTDNLLIVFPTAIGRMPPSFFLMGIHWVRRVLDLQTVELHLSVWRWPDRLIGLKARCCLRRTTGHQRTKVTRVEAIWSTRSTSKKRHDSLSNLFFHGDCRNYRPIMWVGKKKVFWGRRVLFLQGPKCVSILRC